jgi:hypothetical protein
MRGEGVSKGLNPNFNPSNMDILYISQRKKPNVTSSV